MTLNEWCKAVHDLAIQKGFYEKPRSPLESHMLMVSEIAEASEEVRADCPDSYYVEGDTGPVRKPEGEMIELVDCMIRIMDYFAYKDWDLEAALRCKHVYNKTRPHKHGKKF
jgi:hypothetical protein